MEVDENETTSSLSREVKSSNEVSAVPPPEFSLPYSGCSSSSSLSSRSSSNSSYGPQMMLEAAIGLDADESTYEMLCATGVSPVMEVSRTSVGGGEAGGDASAFSCCEDSDCCSGDGGCSSFASQRSGSGYEPGRSVVMDKVSSPCARQRKKGVKEEEEEARISSRRTSTGSSSSRLKADTFPDGSSASPVMRVHYVPVENMIYQAHRPAPRTTTSTTITTAAMRTEDTDVMKVNQKQRTHGGCSVMNEIESSLLCTELRDEKGEQTEELEGGEKEDQEWPAAAHAEEEEKEDTDFPTNKADSPGSCSRVPASTPPPPCASSSSESREEYYNSFDVDAVVDVVDEVQLCDLVTVLPRHFPLERTMMQLVPTVVYVPHEEPSLPTGNNTESSGNNSNSNTTNNGTIRISPQHPMHSLEEIRKEKRAAEILTLVQTAQRQHFFHYWCGRPQEKGHFLFQHQRRILPGEANSSTCSLSSSLPPTTLDTSCGSYRLCRRACQQCLLHFFYSAAVPCYHIQLLNHASRSLSFPSFRYSFSLRHRAQCVRRVWREVEGAIRAFQFEKLVSPSFSSSITTHLGKKQEGEELGDHAENDLDSTKQGRTAMPAPSPPSEAQKDRKDASSADDPSHRKEDSDTETFLSYLFSTLATQEWRRHNKKMIREAALEWEVHVGRWENELRKRHRVNTAITATASSTSAISGDGRGAEMNRMWSMSAEKEINYESNHTTINMGAKIQERGTRSSIICPVAAENASSGVDITSTPMMMTAAYAENVLLPEHITFLWHRMWKQCAMSCTPTTKTTHSPSSSRREKVGKEGAPAAAPSPGTAKILGSNLPDNQALPTDTHGENGEDSMTESIAMKMKKESEVDHCSHPSTRMEVGKSIADDNSLISSCSSLLHSVHPQGSSRMASPHPPTHMSSALVEWTTGDVDITTDTVGIEKEQQIRFQRTYYLPPTPASCSKKTTSPSSRLHSSCSSSSGTPLPSTLHAVGLEQLHRMQRLYEERRQYLHQSSPLPLPSSASPSGTFDESAKRNASTPSQSPLESISDPFFSISSSSAFSCHTRHHDHHQKRIFNEGREDEAPHDRIPSSMEGRPFNQACGCSLCGRWQLCFTQWAQHRSSRTGDGLMHYIDRLLVNSTFPASRPKIPPTCAIRWLVRTGPQNRKNGLSNINAIPYRSHDHHPNCRRPTSSATTSPSVPSSSSHISLLFRHVWEGEKECTTVEEFFPVFSLHCEAIVQQEMCQKKYSSSDPLACTSFSSSFLSSPTSSLEEDHEADRDMPKKEEEEKEEEGEEERDERKTQGEEKRRQRWRKGSEERCENGGASHVQQWWNYILFGSHDGESVKIEQQERHAKNGEEEPDSHSHHHILPIQVGVGKKMRTGVNDEDDHHHDPISTSPLSSPCKSSEWESAKTYLGNRGDPLLSSLSDGPARSTNRKEEKDEDEENGNDEVDVVEEIATNTFTGTTTTRKRQDREMGEYHLECAIRRRIKQEVRYLHDWILDEIFLVCLERHHPHHPYHTILCPPRQALFHVIIEELENVLETYRALLFLPSSSSFPFSMNYFPIFCDVVFHSFAYYVERHHGGWRSFSEREMLLEMCDRVCPPGSSWMTYFQREEVRLRDCLGRGAVAVEQEGIPCKHGIPLSGLDQEKVSSAYQQFYPVYASIALFHITGLFHIHTRAILQMMLSSITRVLHQRVFIMYDTIRSVLPSPSSSIGSGLTPPLPPPSSAAASGGGGGGHLPPHSNSSDDGPASSQGGGHAGRADFSSAATVLKNVTTSSFLSSRAQGHRHSTHHHSNGTGGGNNNTTNNVGVLTAAQLEQYAQWYTSHPSPGGVLQLLQRSSLWSQSLEDLFEVWRSNTAKEEQKVDDGHGVEFSSTSPLSSREEEWSNTSGTSPIHSPPPSQGDSSSHPRQVVYDKYGKNKETQKSQCTTSLQSVSGTASPVAKQEVQEDVEDAGEKDDNNDDEDGEEEEEEEGNVERKWRRSSDSSHSSDTSNEKEGEQMDRGVTKGREVKGLSVVRDPSSTVRIEERRTVSTARPAHHHSRGTTRTPTTRQWWGREEEDNDDEEDLFLRFKNRKNDKEEEDVPSKLFAPREVQEMKTTGWKRRGGHGGEVDPNHYHPNETSYSGLGKSMPLSLSIPSISASSSSSSPASILSWFAFPSALTEFSLLSPGFFPGLALWLEGKREMEGGEEGGGGKEGGGVFSSNSRAAYYRQLELWIQSATTTIANTTPATTKSVYSRTVYPAHPPREVPGSPFFTSSFHPRSSSRSFACLGSQAHLKPSSPGHVEDSTQGAKREEDEEEENSDDDRDRDHQDEEDDDVEEEEEEEEDLSMSCTSRKSPPEDVPFPSSAASSPLHRRQIPYYQQYASECVPFFPLHGFGPLPAVPGGGGGGGEVGRPPSSALHPVGLSTVVDVLQMGGRSMTWWELGAFSSYMKDPTSCSPPPVVYASSPSPSALSSSKAGGGVDGGGESSPPSSSSGSHSSLLHAMNKRGEARVKEEEREDDEKEQEPGEGGGASTESKHLSNKKNDHNWKRGRRNGKVGKGVSGSRGEIGECDPIITGLTGKRKRTRAEYSPSSNLKWEKRLK